MRHRGVAALVLVLGFGAAVSACGAKADTKTMPDVAGKTLDIAKSDIKSAGFDGDVKVDGGGIFGVIVDSNWTVCSQTPAAGQPLSGTPEVAVDRSCSGLTSSAPASDPASVSASPPESQTTTAPTSRPTTSTPPAPSGPLTAKNSADLKTLLRIDDSCDPKIGVLAKKLAGEVIQFDGSVLGSGAGLTTVAPGDKGDMSVVGPNFQFRGVLHVNAKFTITGDVGAFNGGQCVLRLDNVSTRAR